MKFDENFKFLANTVSNTKFKQKRIIVKISYIKDKRFSVIVHTVSPSLFGLFVDFSNIYNICHRFIYGGQFLKNLIKKNKYFSLSLLYLLKYIKSGPKVVFHLLSSFQ